MSTSRKGIFISFEGIDGCGKSTQVKLLLEKLAIEGFITKLVREPGGAKICEDIREILLDNNNINMSSRSEALLMTASRAQLTKEEIIPALNNDKCVIADRFKDSTLAYQGGGRNLDIEFLIKLNDFATNNIDPDITFFLDISAETAHSRSNTNKLDRIESIGVEFQNTVREKYLNIAERFKNRIVTINGNETKSLIHSRVWEKTINFLNERK